MRLSHIARVFVLCFAAVLPSTALAQTSAECEYSNPDNPNWNYLRACTITSTQDGARTTTTAQVSNGSTLTVVADTAGGALRFEVNGYAATRLEDGASRCYLTTDDEETICLHFESAERVPVEAAPSEPSSDPAPSSIDLADANIGGGEAGYCLAWVTGVSREGLIGQGACIRRTDCAEIEGADGMSCLVDYLWENGLETVLTNQGSVRTLDGAVAVSIDDGCFTDVGAGQHFCFSSKEMTVADYPALALPPAPALPQAVAAPATAPASVVSSESVSEDAGLAETVAPTENRCSFLRDEVEVSSWSCIETIACEAPICTVIYALENNTTVTLDTADGKVMLMNGAKTNPADWHEGGVIDVTRPGAPYTFRFIPGTVAAAAAE